MEFRKATLSDVPHLCALRRQQLIDEGATDHPDIRKEMEGFFTAMLTQDRLVQFLGVEDGRIVATGGVCFYTLPPSFTNSTGQMAYIANMYTHPDFRGQGVATHILDLLAAESRARGVNQSLLFASSLGRPVYEKYGYQAENSWLGLKLDQG